MFLVPKMAESLNFEALNIQGNKELAGDYSS